MMATPLVDSMRFGVLLLRQWSLVRQLPEFEGVLPPTPGPGMEDLDICHVLVRALEGLHPAMRIDHTKTTHRELAEQAHFCARWASFGFPVFTLTESLSASFSLSDPGSVSSAALKLPFDSFVIELPWPQTPFQIETIDGRLVGVRWIHVHRTDVCATEADREKMRKLTRLEMRTADIGRQGVYIIRLMSESGLSVFEAIKVPPAGPLANWFAWGYQDRDINDSPLGDGQASHPTSRRDRIAIQGARSFMANLCLYVAALKHENRWAKPASGGNGPKKPSGDPAPMRWVLGREIKLSPELRLAARTYSERGERRAFWKLAARYVVRGHWRNQACGPRHSEHRPVWIAPHWKGPVAAPGLVRPMAVT